MRKCAICYFAVQMLFFAVQIIFFWCAVQIFAVSLLPLSVSFCYQMGRILSPCGGVLPPYVKFLKRSTKVCGIFLSGWVGCKSLSMDSLLLSKIP